MSASAGAELETIRKIEIANVFKQGLLAGTLRRTNSGAVSFQYLPDYVRAGVPIGFSLPLQSEPVITPNGGVPPFFAGLLPEGYRLTALQGRLKVSPSDELSLLLAVGADTPGDVQVLPDAAELRDFVSPPSPQIRDAQGNYDFSQLREALDLHAIPGVQDKVSAQMITAPARDQAGHSILKLNPAGYPGLVENEYAHLQAAKLLGLPVANAQLIRDKYGEPGLLVHRFDRAASSDSGRVSRLALEDATQVMGLTPAQKYNLSSGEVVEALASCSTAGLVARRNLFMQFLFAWLTGNGDLHGKNVAVLQRDQRWGIAPMYDLPSTLIYGDDTMALDIDGRRKKLRWRHWENFGEAIGLPERSVLSAARKVAVAAASVDWNTLPFSGSPLNGTQRELRFRRAELPI